MDHKLPTTNINDLIRMAVEQLFYDEPDITRWEAAELLGMTERTLYRYLKKHPGLVKRKLPT